MELKPSTARWRESRGDDTFALDWPLNENSHIWEIGGFEGRWVQQIWERFHCNITVFEPQLWAADKLEKRFDGVDKIKIRRYGLWTEEARMSMGAYGTDGCGPLTTKTPHHMGLFKDYRQEVIEHPIDVCLMNIEGCEYILLPSMIETGFINHFTHFWCQFHTFVLDDRNSVDTHKIFLDMGATHDKMWDFFPTAVAWRKR